MSRRRISARAGLVILLVGFALASGACDAPDEPGSVTQATGECVREHDALINLLLQPKNCSVTADCPKGSHCSLETGKCEWQCASDSDCGLGGQTCDCAGYCTASTSPQTPAADE